MQRLDTRAADFDTRLDALTHWQEQLDQSVTETVTAIIADVASRGDTALLEYTARHHRFRAVPAPLRSLHYGSIYRLLGLLGPISIKGAVKTSVVSLIIRSRFVRQSSDHCEYRSGICLVWRR